MPIKYLFQLALNTNWRKLFNNFTTLEKLSEYSRHYNGARITMQGLHAETAIFSGISASPVVG